MKKTKTQALSLSFAWRMRLYFWVEGDKLWAEGDKLWAEGDKLWAEGGKLWAEAVIAVHGPRMTIEWTSTGCTLGSGESFKMREPK